MARRSVPPPGPKPPILSVGQKRRRIERLQKCITNLEAFDHQKVRKRSGNPEVATLEAAIGKALSSAFGRGTPAYVRFDLAATLHGPLITNAALPSSGRRRVGGQGRRDAQVQEARQYFSEGKERSIALLREAIGTLESEIAAAQPFVEVAKEPKDTQRTDEIIRPALQSRRGGGIDFNAAWHRMGRWWRGRIAVGRGAWPGSPAWRGQRAKLK